MPTRYRSAAAIFPPSTVVTSVKFKWFKGDALIYTSDAVTVKQSPGWRTWLYKTVDTAGDWKVQVVDADDKAVHELAFSVQ